MPYPNRRLDDRIRELCSKALASSDHENMHEILSELQSAVREAIERLRSTAVGSLVERRELPPDRRKVH